MSIDVAEAHEALLQFLYLAPVGIVQIDAEGVIALVNPVCAQLLMPLSSDGDFANLFDLLEDVAPDLRSMTRAFEPSHGMVCQDMHLYLHHGVAGRRETQIVSLTLLKLNAQRLTAVLSDVTQSVRRDRELRQSQAWIQTIATGLTDYALLALDEQGRVQAWNPSICRLTGFDKHATIGQSHAMFYAPELVPVERALDRLQEADASGWSLDEGWRVRADGTRFWGSCLIAPLQPADHAQPEPRGYSLILRDISHQREANEAMRRSVTCDHLTGLANRRALFEAAELEITRWRRWPRPLSVVLIDADQFKRINDRHGHAAGDAVLCHLAAGMSATFRASDAIGRLGGEEFVVLLPGCDIDQAIAMANRLCSHIAAATVEVDGVPIHYTVSAGIASMEAGVDSVHTLIERADVAMYAAKSNGRNRVERWHDRLEVPVASAYVI